MTPGGGPMDPNIMALIKQFLAQQQGGAGGMPSMGGIGQPPMGQLAGPSPLGAPGVPGAPPGPGGAGLTAANAFGPSPGAPQPPAGLSPAAMPPQPPAPGQTNPMLQGVGMTLEQAGYGGQERDLDRQAKLADELRNEATPGMRGGGGRVQTAANPLEMLSTGLDRYRGNQQDTDVAAKRNDLFEERMRKLRESANGGM